jgi:hypothetical protein
MRRCLTCEEKRGGEPEYYYDVAEGLRRYIGAQGIRLTVSQFARQSPFPDEVVTFEALMEELKQKRPFLVMLSNAEHAEESIANAIRDPKAPTYLCVGFLEPDEPPPGEGEAHSHGEPDNGQAERKHILLLDEGRGPEKLRELDWDHDCKNLVVIFVRPGEKPGAGEH